MHICMGSGMLTNMCNKYRQLQQHLRCVHWHFSCMLNGKQATIKKGGCNQPPSQRGHKHMGRSRKATDVCGHAWVDQFRRVTTDGQKPSQQQQRPHRSRWHLHAHRLTCTHAHMHARTHATQDVPHRPNFSMKVDFFFNCIESMCVHQYSMFMCTCSHLSIQ